MSRFIERAPAPGDQRALELLEQACFPDPWPGRFFAKEMAAPRRYCRVLADPGDQLVGYLFCAWQHLDLHVLKIGVAPGFRRQGLGRRLMESAERHVESQGGESVTLEVRESNAEARVLYRGMGYRWVGTRPRYYPDGEDALVMTKMCIDSESLYDGSLR